jgi:small subunit ribosomal protein S19
MPREFTFRGYTSNELKEMSMDNFIHILSSRQRRSLLRGLSSEQKKIFEKIRKSNRAPEKKKSVLRTHCRDLIILPELEGKKIFVHNGKEFISVEITPEKIGHYLGEFVITNQRVRHGTPGIGASRSSMYVPLK